MKYTFKIGVYPIVNILAVLFFIILLPFYWIRIIFSNSMPPIWIFEEKYQIEMYSLNFWLVTAMMGVIWITLVGILLFNFLFSIKWVEINNSSINIVKVFGNEKILLNSIKEIKKVKLRPAIFSIGATSSLGFLGHKYHKGGVGFVKDYGKCYPMGETVLITLKNGTKYTLFLKDVDGFIKEIKQVIR